MFVHNSRSFMNKMPVFRDVNSPTRKSGSVFQQIHVVLWLFFFAPFNSICDEMKK